MQTSKLFDCSGRNAVFVGGASALGSPMAAAVMAAGARMILTSRQLEKAEVAVSTIQQKVPGGQANALQWSPGEAASNVEFLDGIARLGVDAVDILFVMAGGNMPAANLDAGPLTSLPIAAGRDVFEQNYWSNLAVIDTLLPQIAKSAAPSIVLIGSMAAHITLSKVMFYGAAKAALENTAAYLAVHLGAADKKTRVNAIVPGFFIGEQNRKLLLKDDDSLTPRGKAVIDHTPLGRFGVAEELAGAAVFLASNASCFVTGHALVVDGGFLHQSI